MLLICPGCKANFIFDDARIDTAGVKLRCFRCATVFKVVRKTRAPSPRGAALVAGRPSQVVKFVVAHESPSFCEAVKRVLASEPFLVYDSTDGGEAMAIIERLKPDVVLLDVALPTMYGFEICEAMRNNHGLAHTKIILLAAIYDKRRYRRDPASLYGADEVIEKHCIPDQLIPMIYELVGSAAEKEHPGSLAGGGEPEPSVVQEQEWLEEPAGHAADSWSGSSGPDCAGEEMPADWLESTLNAAAAGGLVPPMENFSPSGEAASGSHLVEGNSLLPEVVIEEAAAPLPAELAQSFVEEITVGESLPVTEPSPVSLPADTLLAHEKARRLARIIVADIALYNPEKMANGIKKGTIHALLAEEFAEGEALYAQRVSAEVRSGTAYLEEAFQQLIDKKRREYGV